MSDIFAEATVRISPSLTGFKTDLESQLKEIMAKVKVQPIRIKPALTRDFVGDLRKQVNAAILQAQKGVKPVIIRTVVETPSRRQLRDLVQAPVSLGAVTGHIAPTGGVAGGVIQNQEALNRALAAGGRELGGLTKIEKEVTKVRQKSSAAAKTQETQQQKINRVNKEAAQIESALQKRIFTEATATGELAQAKKGLGITNEAVAKADKLRAEQVTAETIRVQELARAEQRLALERVQALQTAGPTSPAKQAVSTAGQAAVVRQAKAIHDAQTIATQAAVSGAAAQKQLIEPLKLQTLETKDLTAAKKFETESTKVQKTAHDALKLSLKSGNIAVIEATDRTFKQANAQKLAAVEARKLASAADKEAAGQKRRAEQLSRGGQASILSLAGIRGATLAASRSFLVGAAAITVFAKAVRQFADLERNLDVFRATTSATAQQMEAVRKEATALGADLTLPAVSAGDAAGAMVELAKAGLTVQDSIAGARGVLQLATAAAIDTADAVRLTANVLNAFALSGREAITVADTLANAANLSQGSIADIGTAFQQAASAGHQVGLSFQDTATFLTILAKNGLRGSDAGTSLRTALIRLVNPSEKAKQAFKDLGISLRDAAGNLRPDVFLQIAAATEKLGPAQRDATIALIGGQDAFRAVTILGRQSIKTFLSMRAALREQGTAAELSKARTEGLHGAMDGLQSVLETVGTNLAGHVGPALANFVRTTASGITSLSQNQAVLGTLSQGLTTTSNSFNVLGQAMSAVGAIALPLTATFLQLSNAIGGAQLAVSIGAAAIAFKAFQAVLGSSLIKKATVVVTGLSETFVVARGEALAAAAGTRVLTASLIGLRTAASAAFLALGGWVTVAIAAAGAIFFLSQREDSFARASKNLTTQTNNLADALGRVAAAREGVRSTQRDTQTTGFGLEQSRLNAAIAQQALLNSTAARGSVERRQLELNLAIAVQNVTFATQDYAKALKDAQSATDESLAANQSLQLQRKESVKTLDDLISKSVEVGRVFGFEGRAPDAIGKEVNARRILIATLQEQAKADLLSQDDAKKAIGARETLILQMVQRSKIPLADLQASLNKAFSADTLSGALRVAAKSFNLGGKDAVDAFVKSVMAGLAQHESLAKAIQDAIKAAMSAATPTSEEGGHEQANAFLRGYVFQFQQNQPALADAASKALTGAQKLALLEVTGGSLQAQLAQAQKNQAEAARKLAKVRASGNTGDALDQAISEKSQADSDVERIQGEITGIARDTTQKIQDAQKDRDTEAQKQIDALLQGRKATLLQRKITSAGLSEWLGDDLKTTQAWLNYLKNLAKTLPARLKAAGASRDLIVSTMKALRDLIFDTTNSIKKLNEDITKNTKERRKALEDILLERLDLRIQIAQSQENVAAEIRARRAKIEALTKELVRMKKAYGKNSVEWLRVKAAIEEERAAIRDLTKSQKGEVADFQKFLFENLQAQQGFASNLLSNIIPFGGLAGTVGGRTPIGGTAPSGSTSSNGGTGSGALFFGREPGTGGPFPGGGRFGGGSGVDPVTGMRTADAVSKGVGGPTRGGQSRELFLLNQILHVLRAMARGDRNPESNHHKQVRTTAGDTQAYGHGW